MKQRLWLAIALAIPSGFTIAATSDALALPMASKAAVAGSPDTVHQVGMACDDWGRCWRTGPSYNYGGGWGSGPYYGGGWRPQPSYYYGGGYGPNYGGGWGHDNGWRGHHGHHGHDDD